MPSDQIFWQSAGPNDEYANVGDTVLTRKTAKPVERPAPLAPATRKVSPFTLVMSELPAKEQEALAQFQSGNLDKGNQLLDEMNKAVDAAEPALVEAMGYTGRDGFLLSARGPAAQALTRKWNSNPAIAQLRNPATNPNVWAAQARGAKIPEGSLLYETGAGMFKGDQLQSAYYSAALGGSPARAAKPRAAAQTDAAGELVPPSQDLARQALDAEEYLQYAKKVNADLLSRPGGAEVVAALGTKAPTVYRGLFDGGDRGSDRKVSKLALDVAFVNSGGRTPEAQAERVQRSVQVAAAISQAAQVRLGGDPAARDLTLDVLSTLHNDPRLDPLKGDGFDANKSALLDLSTDTISQAREAEARGVVVPIEAVRSMARVAAAQKFNRPDALTPNDVKWLKTRDALSALSNSLRADAPVGATPGTAKKLEEGEQLRDKNGKPRFDAQGTPLKTAVLPVVLKNTMLDILSTVAVEAAANPGLDVQQAILTKYQDFGEQLFTMSGVLKDANGVPIGKVTREDADNLALATMYNVMTNPGTNLGDLGNMIKNETPFYDRAAAKAQVDKQIAFIQGEVGKKRATADAAVAAVDARFAKLDEILKPKPGNEALKHVVGEVRKRDIFGISSIPTEFIRKAAEEKRLLLESERRKAIETQKEAEAANAAATLQIEKLSAALDAGPSDYEAGRQAKMTALLRIYRPDFKPDNVQEVARAVADNMSRKEITEETRKLLYDDSILTAYVRNGVGHGIIMKVRNAQVARYMSDQKMSPGDLVTSFYGELDGHMRAARTQAEQDWAARQDVRSANTIKAHEANAKYDAANKPSGL